MGGLGYSRYAQVGVLYHDSEVNQTYEGDNDILQQQTAKMLFRNLSWMMKGKHVLETCEFMTMDDPDMEELRADLSVKNMIRLFKKRAKDLTFEAGQTLSTAP